MAETKIIGGVPPTTTYGIPGTEQVVDATYGASRVVLKPNDFALEGVAGGHYQLSTQTGLITGIAAAGPVFAFRWAPTNGGVPYALIKKVQLGWGTTTTAVATPDFDMILARQWTVSDSGGTALTPFTGNSQKLRSQFFSTSLVADCRVATTAAITAGTRTLDQFAITSTPMTIPNTTALSGAAAAVDLYKEDAVAQHPLLLAANEGFVIRVVTAMSTTAGKLYITVNWAEVPGI